MHAKEVAMVIAVALLGALFVGLFFDAIYESPSYEEYCKETFVPKPMPYQECQTNTTPEDQAAAEQCYRDNGFPEYNDDARGCPNSFASCNFCQKEFNLANQIYNRNLFLIIAPLGVLAIVVGLFLSYEVIGTGFMFSGILLVAYATMRYFSEMSKLMRAVVIFIELLILIVISIKKLKK
ncbi:hypothetical protein HYW21_04040 [Candidatus Woesearchaeota archaeon]|nr:hypothetical protein [Candidatus Woesearchaeota archaeon]